MVLYYAKMPEFGAAHPECKEHWGLYESMYWQKDPFVRSRVKQKLSTWEKGLKSRGRFDYPRIGPQPERSIENPFGTAGITK